MKAIKVFFVVIMLSFSSSNLFPQFILQAVKLDGNNISTYFINRGIFNNTPFRSSSGFEWPIYSNKHAIYTTGLCIAAKVQGQLAESMASYTGEFAPGLVLGGNYFTDTVFKIYKIKRGDNAYNNPDYANWPMMIPFGAPYIDVNNNHVYEEGIDSIGIRNAVQVLFLVMTDCYAGNHDPGEGFGGGITSPFLLSQITWTSWCYDRGDLKDIQFMKWEISNKSLQLWDSTYFSVVCDPDLGGGSDDYIGCDTSKKLGYCYNADNNDDVYGANPPAVGIILLSSPKGLTSFTYFTNTGSGGPPCETDPNGEPYSAYNMMKGLKKERSNFMNPLVNPPEPTKFVYTGDPETNTGWTEYKGSVQNCGGNIGNIISVNIPGDRRFIMSSGAGDFVVYPGDTLIFCTSQIIARGNSNLNSVTLLKNLANVAWSVYNGGFNVGIKQQESNNIPKEYLLYQNYPNPFNPNTMIRFRVKETKKVLLKVFEVNGREIQTLVNDKLKPGMYEVNFDGSNLSSGIYFYKITTDEYSETRKMILLK